MPIFAKSTVTVSESEKVQILATADMAKEARMSPANAAIYNAKKDEIRKALTETGYRIAGVPSEALKAKGFEDDDSRESNACRLAILAGGTMKIARVVAK